MEIAAILQQPDDRWKPLLQFPEWPFIKVEKPLLASSRTHSLEPQPASQESRGRKGGSVFSHYSSTRAPEPKLLKLYTILKKNAFNHRLFMEKIPIKLLSTIEAMLALTSLRQAATSTKSQHLRYFSPCQTAYRSSAILHVKPLNKLQISWNVSFNFSPKYRSGTI